MQDAHRHFYRALSIAIEMRYYPLLSTILNYIAAMFFSIGEDERGRDIATLVLHHPASEQEAKARANALLCEFDSSGPQVGRPNQESDATLESTVHKLLDQLAKPALSISPTVTSQEHLLEPLTERELEVLQLLAQGMVNHEIAERLNVAIGTVKSHNHNIYGKLGVDNRAAAGARARELNLV